MKRKLVLILALIMLSSMSGCSGSDNSEKEKDTPQSTISSEGYEEVQKNTNKLRVNTSEELELVEDYNMETIQGKIEEYKTNNVFNAFFVDGVLYEYDTASDDENAYVCWDIGDYNNILYYSENVCVIENKDATVTAFVAEQKNNHVCETRKIILPITAEQFILCDANAEKDWLSLTYEKDGEFYHWVTQLDGTILSSGTISSIMDEEAAAFGVTDLIFNTNKDGLYAINEQNQFRTFELRVTGINDKYYIDCFLNDHDFGEFQDVDKWVELSALYQLIVSKKGDSDNLHFYKLNGTLMDPDMEFLTKVQLPEGQKAEKIIYTQSGLNYTLIQFENGDFYKLYHNNVFNPYSEEPPVWCKMEGLTNIAKNSKQITKYRAWIGVLKDDGKFYRLMNDGLE